VVDNSQNKLPIVKIGNDNNQNRLMDDLSNYPPHNCPVLPKDLELDQKLMNNEKIDYDASFTTYVSNRRKKKNKLYRVVYQARFQGSPFLIPQYIFFIE